jgi:twitching motility two-component system response regulator PilG
MTSNSQQELTTLQEGIALALKGEKASARKLLDQVIEFNPKNELAWLWLASVSETNEDCIHCWRQVLRMNATSEHAVNGLRRLLFQEGIASAKAGDKVKARELLIELSQIDDTNEVAFLWLATVAKDAEEASKYTRRVLEINPANDRAKAFLQKLEPQAQAVVKVAPSTVQSSDDFQIALSTSGWSCPLCGSMSLKSVSKCPKCMAVVSLANLDEILNNPDVNVPIIRESVRRLEDQCDRLGLSVDYFTLYNLGLGYLNLKRIDEGTRYLQDATRLKQKDVKLKAQVEALLQRSHGHAVEATQNLNTAEPVPEEIPSTDVTAKTGCFTILAVDDSPTIQKIITMSLSKYGHHVITAGNGLEALNRLKEVVPDVILSDITMPHMDGYQLCKMIRGNSVTRQIPVIMLSGKDGIFDKLRGKMVGATAYITKPFETDKLLQTIDMHCQQVNH